MLPSIKIGPFIIDQTKRRLTDIYNINQIFAGGINEETLKVIKYYNLYNSYVSEKDIKEVILNGFDITFDKEIHPEGLDAFTLFHQIDPSSFNTRITLRQIMEFCVQYNSYLKIGSNLFSFLHNDGMPCREMAFIVEKDESNILSASSIWIINVSRFHSGVRLIVPEINFLEKVRIF